MRTLLATRDCQEYTDEIKKIPPPAEPHQEEWTREGRRGRLLYPPGNEFSVVKTVVELFAEK